MLRPNRSLRPPLLRLAGSALSLVLLGCGGGGAGGDAGSPFSDAGPAADAGDLPGTSPVVVFAYDESLSALFRLADADGDGDLHDAGEAVRFYDDDAPLGLRASRALVALGPRTVVAGDLPTIGPGDLARLTDLDGDGDATSIGEGRALFAGAIAGADSLAGPLAVAPTPAGYLVLDRAASVADAPSVVVRLVDGDDDGVIAADEASVWYAPSATVNDLVVDAGGRAWLLELGTDGDALVSLDLDTAEPTTALTGAALARARDLVLAGGSARLGLSPDGTLYFQTLRGDGFAALCAARDADHDGRIAADRELTVAWDERLHLARPSNFVAHDLVAAPDGSVLALVATQGTVHRFADGNGDGDFDDPGEDRVVYDTAQAVASGGENTAAMLSLAVAAE